MENISVSGIKVAGQVSPEPGESVGIRVGLPESEPLVLNGLVARRYQERGSSVWHLGIQFISLNEEQLRVLRKLVATDPAKESDAAKEAVRSARRVRTAARMSLKARLTPSGGGKRSYVSIVDLSESGFRAVPRFPLDLKNGEVLGAQVLWNGQSFTGQAEVVRRMWVEDGPGGHWHFGLRFLFLDANSRQLLSEIVAAAAQRGIRRPPRTQKSQALEAPQSSA
jgi:hypothetical protein